MHDKSIILGAYTCEGVCIYTCTCKYVPKTLIALFDYEIL